MRVLGIDTSTMWQSCAIVDEAGTLLAEDGFDSHRRTNALLVIIDRACRAAGVAPGALAAVAVGAGPGTFTGLRIGMATAKGIAFAAKCPLWTVSSLAALAVAADAPAVCAVIDARKGEVFAGCYHHGRLVGDERVLPPGELAAWVDATLPEARFVGNAFTPADPTGDGKAPSYADVLAPLADRWLASPKTPPATVVARLALAGPREDVLLAGAPTYIRPSEAEVRYPNGMPGALRTLQKP